MINNVTVHYREQNARMGDIMKKIMVFGVAIILTGCVPNQQAGLYQPNAGGDLITGILQQQAQYQQTQQMQTQQRMQQPMMMPTTTTCHGSPTLNGSVICTSY
jgi:hypothetical protein